MIQMIEAKEQKSKVKDGLRDIPNETLAIIY